MKSYKTFCLRYLTFNELYILGNRKNEFIRYQKSWWVTQTGSKYLFSIFSPLDDMIPRGRCIDPDWESKMCLVSFKE